RAVANAQQKQQKLSAVHHLLHEGVYTETTQNLVPAGYPCYCLVKAGCSRHCVNDVIHAVLKSAGITAIWTISRTSVSCIIAEGYIAAQIQLGYELGNTDSMTFSADGTAHRSINYNFWHVNLTAEDYSSDSNKKEKVTHFLGIQPSLDGDS
ncbi:hypothetical protein L208DRAFT_1313187, partial [Tricholoma matsutake]